MSKQPRANPLKPSRTAWFVAAAGVYLSHHPTFYTLVPDAAVGPMRACIRRASRFRAGLIDRAWFRKRIASWERRHLPGITLHLAARKLYVEAAVRRAAAQEFAQVVVLGAGYDTLALRLHTEFPRITFIEVDHPATQRIKVQAALAPVLPAPNLAVVAADLSQTILHDALAACPIYKPHADTLVIAEGLLMYLSPDDVDGLLRQVHDLGVPIAMPGDAKSAAPRPRPRQRLVFSFLEPVDGGPPGFPKASHRFERSITKNEPFRWGIDRNKLTAYLADRGYRVEEIAGTQTLRQRVLAGAVPEGEPMAQGEFLCIADRV